MAEETAERRTGERRKGKESFFKKKVAGIPMPVILVGGGVLAYLLYTHFKNAGNASSSSAATPTASTGTPTDTSGGLTGGGGSTGDGSGGGGETTPASPTGPSTDVPPGTPTPGFLLPNISPNPNPSPTSPGLVPLGKQTLTLGGKAYPFVANFTQNGATYYGVDNPTEAKQLEAAGYSLVRNPNDPSGKGLFLRAPGGVVPKPVKHKPVKHRPASHRA